MSDLLHSIEPDTLLAHHEWMRRLARRLVLDDSEADDVVQEAWLKAVERPPVQPGALRAWLATVVRNAAKQLARGESRRDKRELAAAQPEALPATADLVARAEARRLMLDATLALTEPSRSTILLRFFEALPPREISRRQGVPVETVRSRVRRGLAEMRKTLDRRTGDRKTWSLALLPLAGPALPGSAPPGEIPTDAPLPGPTSGLPWAAAAAALVAAGAAVGWVAAAALGPETAPDALLAAIRAEESRAHDLRRDASRTRQRGGRRARVPTPEPTATPPAEAAETVAPASEDSGGPPSEAVRDVGPSTPFPAYRVALGTEDWDAAGRAFAALIRSVRDIAEPIAQGEQPSAESVGDVQTSNAPILALALRLRARGVPGVIPNLVLAHPAVLTNLLPPTLAALGTPLTPEQETRLMRAAWDGIRSFDESRAALRDDDIVLRRMAVETAALGPWLAAVNDVLTDRQRSALRPEAFRDRAGIDLVSPGLLWPALPPRVEAAAAEDYVRKLDSLLLAPTFPEGTQERESARDILETWAASLPTSAFARTYSPLDASGFAHAERLAFWAEQTADLLEALRDGAAATRQQREQLARRLIPFLPFMPVRPPTEHER
jgi:RNA polymerase sigma factor (sigma-70 family)